MPGICFSVANWRLKTPTQAKTILMHSVILFSMEESGVCYHILLLCWTRNFCSCRSRDGGREGKPWSICGGCQITPSQCQRPCGSSYQAQNIEATKTDTKCMYLISNSNDAPQQPIQRVTEDRDVEHWPQEGLPHFSDTSHFSLFSILLYFIIYIPILSMITYYFCISCMPSVFFAVEIHICFIRFIDLHPQINL